MYIGIGILNVDYLCIGGGSAVDAGIVHTGKHQHVVIGLVADAAHIAYVHF